MPIDDTVSEAQAWDLASNSQSTYIDTYSEPPRCTGKFADKVMNRAYGGLDPDESIVSPNNNSSSAGSSGKSSSNNKKSSSRSSKGKKMDPAESTTTSSVASKSTRISKSCRRARMSDEPTKGSVNNKASSRPHSSSSSRLNDSGSISGRSTMSLLERRIKSGRSVTSSSSKKKSATQQNHQQQRGGTDPNGTLALIQRKPSIDPPSVAGSVHYFQDSKSGALVPVDYTHSHHTSYSGYSNNDPPSTDNDGCGLLSTCPEEEETRRSSVISGEIESHYDSYHSGSYDDNNSGSYTSSSSEEEDSGTIEDADDSMMASVAENALAIRDDTDITVPSMSNDRALVTTTRSTTGGERAIVPSQQRYLASAVDNQAAMVPFDSTLFESYDHTFVICPEDIRFLFLYTFLKKNADKKILVFFSTTNSVKFHSRLLEHFHIPVLSMHGKQKKQSFINTFFKFSDLEEGILCATDAEGRDLDIPPSVDWVVQFEPPEDPTEYILRVSRISCDSDRVGRSLLFLNPGETGFLKYYHSAAIPVREFEIPKLADIQASIEHHVNSSERFLRYAEDAYGSYLIAYASHSFRDVYNVHDLNKNDVARAFGLVKLPMVESEDEESVASGNGGLRESTQSAGQAPAEVRSKTWTSNKKPKEKTWLKGEKSWPHCKIKVHPKFREGYVPKEDEE